MARAVRLCKTGDGNKHYARGYCAACYMKLYRGNPDAVDESNVERPEVEPKSLNQSELDDILSSTSARYPSSNLATDTRDTDSDGVRKMRSRLNSVTYLARREIVRTMLLDGYAEWQIKNEFLVRKELFKRFIEPLIDPDRTLESDIRSIKAEGRSTALARYTDGLHRSLRRANAFADNPDLNAKERSSWAKAADEIQRNLAILEKAIHVVPGRGDLPLGSTEVATSGRDDDDDVADDSGYKLPDVEGDYDYDDDDDEEE